MHSSCTNRHAKSLNDSWIMHDDSWRCSWATIGIWQETWPSRAAPNSTSLMCMRVCLCWHASHESTRTHVYRYVNVSMLVRRPKLMVQPTCHVCICIDMYMWRGQLHLITYIYIYIYIYIYSPNLQYLYMLHVPCPHFVREYPSVGTWIFALR